MGLIFCSGWSWPSDKPYFHLQTRRMGCSAKCFFTGSAAALRRQPGSGKAAPGDAEHRPSWHSLATATCWEEKPPDETPAQTKPAQKSLKVTGRDRFSKKLHKFILCLSPSYLWRAGSRSLRRHRLSGCWCRWACACSPQAGCWVKHSQSAALLPSVTPGDPTTLSPVLCSNPSTAGFSEGCSAPPTVFSCIWGGLVGGKDI